jgi:hypothetical protein
LPNDPVETLMKLNAIAKFDRKPSVRLSSGLMPSDLRWASSLSATSACVDGPDTVSSLYHHESAARSGAVAREDGPLRDTESEDTWHAARALHPSAPGA